MTQEIPKISVPWISALSDTSFTISAAPSILKRLGEIPQLTGYNSVSLPINGPFHAKHLHSEEDVVDIISKVCFDETQSDGTDHLPLLNELEGAMVKDDLKSALCEAIRSMLLEPIQWPITLNKISEQFKSSSISDCKVYTIGAVCESIIQRYLTSISSSLHVQFQELSQISVKLEHDDIQYPHKIDDFSKQSKIAIVGYSGRFPEADSVDGLWRLLSEGLDVHKVVPLSRWDARTHVDPSTKRKNTSATPFGCWLNDAGLFDARFFNMSAREAAQVDPAQRLALLTAYEAIEIAGIVPDSTPSTKSSRVGVWYGVTSNDWMETNSAQNIDTYFIPGGNRAFIPGRINYHFKFTGPSYAIDTACSSSLAAIQLACNAIQRGEVDTAIAGGTNVLTNPDMTAGLDRGHFLSRTGNCRTFDENPDGYCRGEGAATIVLKRMEDAIADDDPIFGLIIGTGTNHSAEVESITRPHAPAQEALISHVLQCSKTNADDVSYVEMHGTGTVVGDVGEMKSVVNSFAPKAAVNNRRAPLYVGSVKANIGHGESVSGISSLAKILLMMRESIIPPHCGIKTALNPAFPSDLELRGICIAKKATSWTKPANGVRKALINNFSAAGGNTVLLVEDAPKRASQVPNHDPRTHHIVAVTAKSLSSLRKNIQALIDRLLDGTLSQAALPSLSYTSTARRIHYKYRAMVHGSTIESIADSLGTFVKSDRVDLKPSHPKKILFAFTGMGSQYVGMARQLFHSHTSFHDHVRHLNRIAMLIGCPSIIPFLTETQGNVDDYCQRVIQVSTVCFEIALHRIWRSWGVIPNVIVGHSLGEYAALNAAGVISEADTIFLVFKRAELMESLCRKGTHAMLAVSSSIENIQDQLQGHHIEIACMNSPRNIVLSGSRGEISRAKEHLARTGIKSSYLPVPYAFHSSQMDPILRDFETIASCIDHQAPSVPILCPLFGTVITSQEQLDKTYFSKHCREPVRLAQAVQAAIQDNLLDSSHVIVELGAHPVLSGLLTDNLGASTVTMPSLERGKDAWSTLTHSVTKLYHEGLSLAWREYHHDFPAARCVISLPSYCWDLKDYWLQYTNDWSLRKGDKLPEQLPALPLLQTTMIHDMTEERIDKDHGRLVLESDLSRPDLHTLLQGHRVDGYPLCTPVRTSQVTLKVHELISDFSLFTVT